MLKLLLFPVTLIYRFVISLRNLLYDLNIFKQYEFEIPIISVGNITVGGTGKTPHAEYIISLLKKQFAISYLSRGYKRKTRGFVLATKKSTCREIGDEPLQIKQKFPEITVAVCEKRVKGIKKLTASDQSPDVIILDDAFQHRSVKPMINILLVDFTRPIYEDTMLPVGRLRESSKARYRANMIIVTKCPATLQPIDRRLIKNKLDIRPYQDLFFTSIKYGEITPALKGASLFDNDLKHYSAIVITGIANPKPLLDYITPIVGNITHLTYSDHYQFKASDIQSIWKKFESLDSKNKMMLTTEKDLVRILSTPDLSIEFQRNLNYIPIEIVFLDKTKDQFNNRILNYATENKSNRRIYSKQNKL